MADQDEDWKKFLAATEEDPEEVETDDELEDEPDDAEEEDEEKDPKKSKKGKGDDADPEKDDPEKDDDDEEEDADEDEDPDDKDYKPRLKQFLNKDGSLNVEKIESSYIENGKEAVKLNNKVKEVEGNYNGLLAAIKAKPDVAKLLFGEEGAKKLLDDSSINTAQPGSQAAADTMSHPLLQHLEAQMNNASKKEYDDFVEAHPESVADPQKARLIGEFLEEHGQVYRRQHNGEIPSMKESLEAAYRYYGWDSDIKKKEDVAIAAKKKAATRPTSNSKHKASKKDITKGEEFFAKKLGVTLKKS